MRIGLLNWLDAPNGAKGSRFANDEGGWDFTSFIELARGAYGVSNLLRERGLSRGGIVSIVVPSGTSFATAFFGTLIAGGTPSPLVPPTVFDDSERYISHTAALLATATEIVLTDNSLREIVARAHHAAALPGEPLCVENAEPADDAPRMPHSDLALLQFTSGSSGRPRGVRVTWENLEANIEMIVKWIAWGPEETGTAWLPLYHDMGLIGCFLTPILYQRDLWFMRPEQFVANPLRWVERFGRAGHSFTAGPNFCFAYAAKRLKPDQLEGMDFSNWRAAIVGAERLDPAALARFAALLEPYGFRREVFLPAYGLAEATLAVSVCAADRVPRVVRPNWETIRFGQEVEVSAESQLGDDDIGNGSGWLVGCGRPLPGVNVGVYDEHGHPLGDGVLGELTVQGATIAAGYAGGAGSTSTSFEDAVLRTGDAGFTLDGEVFVTGRIGDALKVRGVTLYAEDLEARLGAIDGIPKGRCIAIPGQHSDGESVTVIVEAQPGRWVEQATALLKRETNGAGVVILVGPPGTIQRTSSGKPRRRVVWRALVDGELQLEPAAPPEPEVVG
jgi:fatty-acyl-CoA synthase